MLHNIIHKEFNLLQKQKKILEEKIISFIKETNKNRIDINNHESIVRSAENFNQAQKENYFSQYNYVLTLLNDANTIKEFSVLLKNAIQNNKYKIFDNEYKFHKIVIKNLNSLF